MNIIKTNGEYHIYNDLTFVHSLEAKNYVFGYDGFNIPYLQDADDFKLPKKIYDVDGEFRKIIIKSYQHYDTNLGVLMIGNKGQGKTINAKMLCKELNLPVIMITDRIPTDVDFIKFLRSIKQDYILFIDEFEKLFTTSDNTKNGEIQYHSQEKFLSFMDGVNGGNVKILFLYTSNETVNEYLINRPSRIKFLKEYYELPEELFHLITDDLLVNKQYKSDLEENLSFLNLNIDLLISIINDINLLDKPFSEFADMYNYKFEQYRYELFILKKGQKKDVYETTITLDKRPKINTSYFGGYQVKKLLKFTKDEIQFETDYWDDKTEKEYAVTMRLVPLKYTITTTVTKTLVA